jgi:hypothetical protein
MKDTHSKLFFHFSVMEELEIFCVMNTLKEFEWPIMFCCICCRSWGGHNACGCQVQTLVLPWHDGRNPSLGLTTKARGCKVAGQMGDLGALHMLPGVQRVWGNEPSHSQVNSHVGSWSPKRTPESSEHDFRGQNSLPWRVLYIIEKLLKCKCLKWARMAHLDI